MIEWNNEHRYNSFNSWKGLMYKQWYDAILKGEFLPPVEVSVDPVNDCQLDCYFCNGYDVRQRKTRMTREHLLDLCDFFSEWGVKGVCFAGGGEPTLHKSLGEAFLRLYSLKIPVAIITNGLFINPEQLRTVAMYSSWVGVSVDAACPETYKNIKGSDRFDEVISNIEKLITYNPREVTYKFLITTRNQYEIYDAIKKAAELGCYGIHIRPVSYRNFQDKEEEYDMIHVNKQIYQGFYDFGNKLKIFAVRHKFDDKMHVKFPFKKCRATPIMPIFQANGTVTLCIDRKKDDSLILCKHEPIEIVKKIWGSEYHKSVIDKIKIEECPKCTIMHLNEQMERAVMNDEMCWAFV